MIIKVVHAHHEGVFLEFGLVCEALKDFRNEKEHSSGSQRDFFQMDKSPALWGGDRRTNESQEEKRAHCSVPYLLKLGLGVLIDESKDLLEFIWATLR